MSVSSGWYPSSRRPRATATARRTALPASVDPPPCAYLTVQSYRITRAIGEVRPLLAMRGCTVTTGILLRTLTDVIEHLGTSRETGIIDGTEVRVRRPAAGRS